MTRQRIRKQASEVAEKLQKAAKSCKKLQKAAKREVELMHFDTPTSGPTTLDMFSRVPRILRLDLAGQPLEWLSWQDAVCLYARDIVVWTVGEPLLRIRGGLSRADSSNSYMDIHSIVACGGRVIAKDQMVPPLTNKALFGRDRNLCLYCGKEYLDAELTRDHVVPVSRGGRDDWENVVAACKRCNHFKGSRLLQECEMELLALPYVPNFSEYLALINSGRILGDQMDFLRKSFGANSRLLLN